MSLMRLLPLVLALGLAAPVQAGEPADAVRAAGYDEVLAAGYDRDRPRSILWYGGWVGIQTALTAGQLAIALEKGPLFAGPVGSEDWKLQGRMVVGAAAAALGLGAIALRPPPTLRQRPGDSATLRRRMTLTAAQEHGARNWFGQLGVVVVNAASATLVGTLFQSPFDAVVTFLAGMAIGEAQIWTRPFAAARAVRNADARFPLTVAVVPWGPGAMLAGRW